MVAPRSLPDPLPFSSALPFPRLAEEPPGRSDPVADPVGVLASRWADLAPPSASHPADRLATTLRRLAAVLRAEPFRPAAARDIGAELLVTGLCGDPARPCVDIDRVVLGTLRLLRRQAPAALGLTGPEGAARLHEALDQMAAGLAAALLPRGPRRTPLAALDGSEPAVTGDRHYRAFYEQGAVGMVVVTLDGHVIDLNPAMCRMLGIERLERPQPMSDFIHPDDLPDIIERYARILRSDPETMRLGLRLVRPDGEVVRAHMIVSLARHHDGEPSHLMALVEDISERHRVRAGLQHATARDQLRRLPGQALADQWLQRAYAAGGAERVGICSLDIDGFQAVNDSLGDDVGDRLLMSVVGRLQLAAGDDLVTRSGGDEFVVLVADPEEEADACRFADRLQAALATPFVIGTETVTVTASIGVAEAATADSCPTELLRAATVARSWATAMGGGRRVVFDHARDAGEAARYTLLRGLRGGIDRSEFQLVYQPLIRLADGRVSGVEALVRWDHPELGLIGPGRFIELAEHSGAIVPLGRWVLETACERAVGWWHELGPGMPLVSVNVSPVQLAAPGWLHEVTDVLDATGLPPEKLQLEITEQAVLADDPAALHALGELRDAGVRLALDDFGTGWSSLAWLRRLPVHVLKIDGSFIDGLRKPAPDPVDASIVKALIEMAHAIGLEVTAEWVETALQAERLTAMGCDTGQGRWFGDAGPGEWVPRQWRRSIIR
jgi:diguanylate cyclase (GGDEF)-like protein/PAS domain S-box-containing protein